MAVWIRWRQHRFRCLASLGWCLLFLVSTTFSRSSPFRVFAFSPENAGTPALTAQQAEKKLAQKGIRLGPGGTFRPDQPVTRGELAIVLVRMIDYLESRGPEKVSQSKSPPLVTPRIRAALRSFPHQHPAYAAVTRLARGGYLLSSNHGDLFLPTRQNIDGAVTARELSAALAGIASRIAEKRTALEHPGVLQDQRETTTSPGQRRGLNTPPP